MPATNEIPVLTSLIPTLTTSSSTAPTMTESHPTTLLHSPPSSSVKSFKNSLYLNWRPERCKHLPFSSISTIVLAPPQNLRKSTSVDSFIKFSREGSWSGQSYTVPDQNAWSMLCHRSLLHDQGKHGLSVRASWREHTSTRIRLWSQTLIDMIHSTYLQRRNFGTYLLILRNEEAPCTGEASNHFLHNRISVYLNHS